jgi:acyl-CoA synthetase (AMP-forming)/AMP-acid ligase II
LGKLSSDLDEGQTMHDMTLINLLQDRACQHPDQTAYTFLEDGEREGNRLTYQQLDEQAMAIAAYLQAQLTIGNQVLLLYPQGIDELWIFSQGINHALSTATAFRT